MSNLPSVMTHTFSQVPNVEIPRSSFDRSFGHKTTFDAGYLVPVLIDEALPGDTFNCSMSAFARMATPIHPVMDNLYMDSFFFAVPIRLLWDNWQKFNGEQDAPGDSTDYVIPQINIANVQAQSLDDYFGIPQGLTNPVSVSALFHRAYNLIWNQWFRDENLQGSVAVPTDDGPDSDALYSLMRRGKRHDYFTSCLPWPQKGDSVTIPLGTSAPVTGIGIDNNTDFNQQFVLADETGASGPTIYDSAAGIGDDAASRRFWAQEDPNNDGFPNIRADLSNATAATINELRQGFQIQKLLERDARGGTRYTEIVRSHFGVISPDARLQRPEYLGGGSTPVNISPIAQTSSTDNTSPQANLAAVGTASLRNHGFTKSFTEHCIIIGLVSVRADLTYQQGVERMWWRKTRYDFYWPTLSHIGEQAVLNREIFTTATAPFDEQVFGYQERYAEYRYKPSKITGVFNSRNDTPLDAWHLAQEFQGLPTLGSAFIEENPPVDRVIAVQTEPHFLFDSYFSMRCARPMPLYGVPGLIDHF